MAVMSVHKYSMNMWKDLACFQGTESLLHPSLPWTNSDLQSRCPILLQGATPSPQGTPSLGSMMLISVSGTHIPTPRWQQLRSHSCQSPPAAGRLPSPPLCFHTPNQNPDRMPPLLPSLTKQLSLFFSSPESVCFPMRAECLHDWDQTLSTVPSTQLAPGAMAHSETSLSTLPGFHMPTSVPAQAPSPCSTALSHLSLTLGTHCPLPTTRPLLGSAPPPAGTQPITHPHLHTYSGVWHMRSC